MKNKILLGIAVLLILLVITIRYQFKEKFEVFKTSVSQYESAQLADFRRVKESRVGSLSNGDKKIYQLFIEQFDEAKSITEADTSFSFLYLSESVKYKIASLKYIDCLNSKCVIDQQNEANQKLIASKESQLQQKYGETFSLWYSKLKDEKLLKKVNKSGDCKSFFPDINEIYYDAIIWNDFEKFLLSYDSEIRESKIQNEQSENQFLSSVIATKSQLRSNGIDVFKSELSKMKASIITSKMETINFNSPTLGIISYNVFKTSFDKSTFQKVSDYAFTQQWKNNSLSTGAMPYYYCYGSSNYCDNYGCSKISVQTGGADVLVTIKNIYGTVIRHAYINGGYSFTFNVPDGQYQVFFYSGTGWNPNKYMKSTSCGNLHGGFVSGEDVTKDDYISLYSQQMTYELILQQNGNLNTKPSSKDEAF